MVRRLVRDSLVYTVATFMTRGIQLLLLPLYSRLLSPAEFGLNDLINVYAAFVGVCITLEMGQAVARFYPEEPARGVKRQISSTGFLFTLINYLLFIAIGLVAAPRIADALLESSKATGLVRIGVVAAALSAILNYTQAQLRYDFKPLDYSVSSILFVLISTISSIYFIAIRRLGGSGVFFGQISGALIVIAFCILRNRDAYSLSFSFSTLKKLLAFSVPFVFSSLFALGSTYVDRVVLQHALGIDEVGIYGIGAKFSSISSLLLVGFNMAITPLLYANAKSASLSGEIAKLFAGFVPLAGLLCSGTFLFSRELIAMFTRQAYYGAAIVMPILVLSSIIANLYLFTPGMTIQKNTKPIILISACGFVTSLAANLVLVPLFGPIGAAFSSVVTSCVVFGLYYFFSQRCFPIPFAMKRTILPLAIVIISAFAARAADGSFLNGFSKICVKTVVFAGTVILMAMFDPSMKLILSKARIAGKPIPAESHNPTAPSETGRE